MPILYKPSQWAITIDGPTLTEQEHKDSCDINKMLKNASRGAEIRGNPNQTRYGYDDTTMDGLTLRMQKAQLEAEISKFANDHTLTPEELAKIPQVVKDLFPFKSASLTPKQSQPAHDVQATASKDATSAP